MWGIWQGKGKPPFNVYFEPFASEMIHLYQQGTVIVASNNLKGQTFAGYWWLIYLQTLQSNCKHVPKFNLSGVLVMQLFLHENPDLKQIKLMFFLYK